MLVKESLHRGMPAVDQSGFLRERRRLERFTSAACAKDALTASKGLHLSSQKRTQVKENDRLLQVPSSPVVELRRHCQFPS